MTSLWQLKRFEARISLFKSLDCPLALAAAVMNQRFTRYPPVINHNLGWCNWDYCPGTLPFTLSHCNSFEDQAHIDFIFGYLVPIPLKIIRSNSEFGESCLHYSSKKIDPITKKFCTCDQIEVRENINKGILIEFQFNLFSRTDNWYSSELQRCDDSERVILFVPKRGNWSLMHEQNGHRFTDVIFKYFFLIYYIIRLSSWKVFLC